MFATPSFHTLMWAALLSSLPSCADTNAPGSRASRVHGARRSDDPLGAIAVWQRGDAGAQADGVSWGRVHWNEPICATAQWTRDPGCGGSSMRRIVRLRGGAPGKRESRSAGQRSEGVGGKAQLLTRKERRMRSVRVEERTVSCVRVCVCVRAYTLILP